MLTNKPNLVVFSGAGMSAESGISTFRDSDGLWERYRIEEVATPEAFLSNPTLVQDFYNQRRRQIIETEPNAAHHIISRLNEKFNVTVVTQNIDDLHERSGSEHVIHLHGNIRYAKSNGPRREEKYYFIEGWKLSDKDKSDDGYQLRPHVVWFGEEVPMLEVAARKMGDADILIVIGTSLNVYPAAGLIHAVPSNCNKYIIDPKANEMAIPKDFEIIAKGASEGMLYWKEKNT
ncbi:MAG: SIR2 family NAD-dependent protein deacylase [Bacteroidota bacterium]